MNDARKQAIEVLLRCDHHVFFDAMPRSASYRCECGLMFGTDRPAAYLHERTAFLDALLAATQDEPCETCGGDPEFDPLTEAGNRSDLHCPDCINGRRRAGTVPLVLLGPEQVGVIGERLLPEGG